MREGSLSVRNEVLFLNEFQAPQTSYENKELDVWKALLSEEKPGGAAGAAAEIP